ncbi:methyltransferase domain-containing protein [Metallumcola ferriviriculae]|uniref:Methyltransferase n=1 Tax=Metallumcola ferriviriculae TaxID=3039180 RepID=A0AAU0UMU9_9FIRM|nr:methyltransferase domain-containing protein [Desulfitibacteraceae bacterium MK1]
MNTRIKCAVCDEAFSNQNDYLSHLQAVHTDQFNSFIDSLLNLNDTGYILSEHDEETDNNGLSTIKEESGSYIPKKSRRITSWEPDNFKMEATSIWSFPNRGAWATHNAKYRGNCSPYIPRNIILRYSEAGDYVLDQFLGSGTTLVEAKLLNRRGIGVDINNGALKIARNNLSFKKVNCFEPKVVQGTAKELGFIKDNSIDLICTHPPYANIIKYSKNIPGDLSLCDTDDFLEEMKMVADESYRVLKSNKYCSILMGDTRRKKHIIPLGFKVMQVFLEAGFVLKEIVIKEQHNCKATGFWHQKSIDYNFLLIAHEYLFVFRKPE